ncbi:hypothetical protein [Gloeothece verrucosa]|uniref:G domain-containing protein n=1 Tax=Gloeothece verrucosa (strain PCC 7822) TaxID=497965 RepID=E0UMH8_GLOV7|nr:hypothetical protein [Gloeothece verrucosa]ADN18158.1 conserved hypothetical protein [Gloeothece verrucosa PCC 7822]
MGNICIIGPRSSGKTTYLAALAYWQNEGIQGVKGERIKIKPQNPESRELAEQAENILLQGADFEPTGQSVTTVDELSYYSFGIEVKKNLLSQPEIIYLTAKDYPGEVFENIVNGSSSDPIHEEFMNDCFTDVNGCLILLTGWEPETDHFYNRVMSRFIDLMDTYGRSQNLKLAVAMSKCERGEIWSGRIDPETDLFGVHLRRTRQTLRDRIIQKNLKFFAISTFGVLGRNDPRPNREDRIVKGEPASVLRNPSKWQPYNLIQPLYWLSQKPKTKKSS